MVDFMLTTNNNPFDPFTQYDDWLRFDEEKGYFTNALLGRFAFTSDSLPEADNDLAIDEAANKIIALFPLTYKKVFKKD